MNITIFSPYVLPYISGITVHIDTLAKLLSKNHHINLLAFNHSSNKSSITNGNPKIIKMGWNKRISKGFISLNSITTFRQVLKNTDVLVTSVPNVEGLPLVHASSRLGIPIIALTHCIPKLSSSIKNAIVSQVLKKSINYQLKKATAIVTYTKDYAKNTPSLSSYVEKTHIIPPPIQMFSPDEIEYGKLMKIKKKRKWIGYVGRIAAEKGLPVLIQAMQNLPNTTLVLVGPKKTVVGERKTHNNIQRMLNASNVPYINIPSKRGAKLAAVYKALDLLVLPSTNQTEAFGMVQVEAMRQGTPVVATNLPGVRVPIATTGMGLVVDIENSHKMKTAINIVLENKKKYSQKQNITKANKYCLPKDVGASYENILKHLS